MQSLLALFFTGYNEMSDFPPKVDRCQASKFLTVLCKKQFCNVFGGVFHFPNTLNLRFEARKNAREVLQNILSKSRTFRYYSFNC